MNTPTTKANPTASTMNDLKETSHNRKFSELTSIQLANNDTIINIYQRVGESVKDAYSIVKTHSKIIAEAGTVYHETGLTPRELVERNKKLTDANTRAQMLLKAMIHIWVEESDLKTRAQSILDQLKSATE